MNADNQANAPRLGRAERLIYLLFFFSGFPALFYQLLWQRALFRIFGVNTESITVVVTAFMLGLGFGSLAGAELAKFRRISPLLALGCIELGIGIFGIFSLPLFEAVGHLVLGLPLPMTALVVLGLVFVPTLLMGMTLPVLVAHFAPRLGHTGESVGSLYYMNTLGAAAACFVASFLLFPFLGMQDTVFLGAAINLGIGTCALAAYFRDRASFSDEEAAPGPVPAATEESPFIAFRLVLVLAALEGFISLSYEIFFFRVMSVAMGGTAYAFSLTLGAFLFGLAASADRAGRLSRSLSHAALAGWMKRAILTGLVLGFLFLPLLVKIGDLDSALMAGAARTVSSSGSVIMRPSGFLLMAAAFLMVYWIARAWGVLLPCLTELGIRADGKSGMRTGFVYVANIAGAVCGSTLTGFFLTDYFGLAGLAAALVIFGAVFCLLFLLSSRETRSGRTYALAAAGIAVLCFVPRAQHALTPHLFDSLQRMAAAKAPVVEVLENRHGIITVDADNIVYGNGMYDGQFSTDLVHDSNGVFRPYALGLFHPAPHDVLMIGLASGSWAQIIAHEPDVRHFTIVEINPGYLDLIKERPAFAPLLSDPRVSIVIDDGRRWLGLHPERRFDVIVANATIHLRANATNLLSREFLEMIRAHLNPGGVYFYNTTDSLRAQRTGCLVFPFGIRFSNHMLVSASPIDLDFDRWKRILASYEINGAKVLDEARPEDRQRLGELMGLKRDYDSDGSPGKQIESCRSILARSQALRPDTDDNMGTEWRYGFFKGE